MEVEASIESPLVFAGDKVAMSVEFSTLTDSDPPPTLLSGYAAVQGSFRLGEMILSEPFSETKKAGTVLTKRGFDYGPSQTSGGLFAGVLDGLRHLVTQPSQTPVARDEGEYPIFATSQLLLFAEHPSVSSSADETSSDLNTGLSRCSSTKYTFEVTLPDNLPPTYRSRSLHITYNLVVGFERLKRDGTPQDTRLFLPFRLLPKPPTPAEPHPPKFDLREPVNVPPPTLISTVTCNDSSALNDLSLTTGKSAEEKVADNVKELDDFVKSLLDDPKEDVRRRRSSSLAHIPGAQYTKVNYDINRGRHHIAQLVLSRPAIAVGDVLAAQVRFKRPCLHLSVFLELEEVIEEPYAALGSTNKPKTVPEKNESANNSGNGNSTNGEERSNNRESGDGRRSESDENGNDSDRELLGQDTSVGGDSDLVAMTYTIYARQFQGVYGLRELPLFLPTLTSVTPRLDTEQLTANWTLRLEFVSLTGSAFAEEDNELLAKGQVEHEVSTARIPIVVLPPGSGQSGALKTWRL